MTLPFITQWDRTRYSKTWLCTKPSEATIQKHILQRLALCGIQAFPVDAAAKIIRGRATGVLRRAGMVDAAAFVNRGKAGGARKGVVDIVGVFPGGRALFVEVKQPEWLELNPKTGALIQSRGAGKPTPEQLEFLLAMHAQGAVVGIAWSAEDLEAILAKGRNGTTPR